MHDPAQRKPYRRSSGDAVCVAGVPGAPRKAWSLVNEVLMCPVSAPAGQPSMSTEAAR